MGLRDSILAAQDLRHEDVAVPEWGVTLRLSEMTAAELLAYQEAVSKEETAGMVGYLEGLARLVVACARDPETGEAVFFSSDLDAVKTKSLPVLQRLSDKVLALHGKAGEAGKNS